MSTLNGGADHVLGTTHKKEESPTFPYIQETARKNPFNVPESYVRTEEQMEKHLYTPHLSSHLPIIDFGLLSNGNKEELLKLDFACKEWGYFQIVNHGMQIDLMQRVKDAVAEFSELSIKEKIKYAMPPDDMQGYGHTSVDWSDYLVLLVYPTRFRKPQFWPKELKDTIDAYSNEIKRIGEEVINSLSLLLGLEEHGLLDLHREVHQGFRVNYYPPCNTPEKVLGVSPHSDPRTIAIVMQDDDVSGTEIRYKRNWVPITPIPGALVVNVGDVIEILSNGKYKSVEHRAITNKNKKRTTFISYLFPQGDAEIGALDHMIDDQNPKMYKDTTYGEYLRHVLNTKLEGKPHINATKINEWIGE
ncbi:2OG-Fe(II) oxygenase family oxidoreductase [Medicago truncatula]|uniref:2OG-Fe(II) oxygenase family oxidoreductase n=3 Tax=Medicago truncatula TaxID=3880 RepID=A0A072UAU4_MEDTR|nr:2OG-Fe(II) oxygenase family oxidoreductase [Medicago truncatula]